MAVTIENGKYFVELPHPKTGELVRVPVPEGQQSRRGAASYERVVLVLFENGWNPRPGKQATANAEPSLDPRAGGERATTNGSAASNAASGVADAGSVRTGVERIAGVAADRLTLTVDDVAELLRVDRKTIYEACRRKQIPHVRIGRAIRFGREVVEKWLHDGSAAARPARR